MKLVAFGTGKKFGNTEVLVKQALMGAESMGVEVEYVRLADMDLRVCSVCEKPCPMCGNIEHCPNKDDAVFLIDKFLDADGVIFASPVYCLTPNSLFFAFRDRVLGPKLSAVSPQVFGGEPPFAKGRFRERPGALISVGGARTKGWTSMGVSNLYTAAFPPQVRIVDILDAYCVADYGAAAVREDLLEQAWNLGVNLAKAMKDGDHSYKAEEALGCCPSCHLCQMELHLEQQEVECTVCGIRGRLVTKDSRVEVEWPRDDEDQNRLEASGMITHLLEIESVKQVEYAAVRDKVDAAMEKFRAYEACVVASPTKEARKAAILAAAKQKMQDKKH